MMTFSNQYHQHHHNLRNRSRRRFCLVAAAICCSAALVAAGGGLTTTGAASTSPAPSADVNVADIAASSVASRSVVEERKPTTTLMKDSSLYLYYARGGEGSQNGGSSSSGGGVVIEYLGGSDGDDDDFEGWTGKPRVVVFYSPYCGHCIDFKPQYVRMALEYPSTLGASSTPLADARFHAVSCAAHKDVCDRYAIDTYPTLVALPRGVNGPRGANKIQRGSIFRGSAYTASSIIEALGGGEGPVETSKGGGGIDGGGNEGGGGVDAEGNGARPSRARRRLEDEDVDDEHVDDDGDDEEDDEGVSELIDEDDEEDDEDEDVDDDVDDDEDEDVEESADDGDDGTEEDEGETKVTHEEDNGRQQARDKVNEQEEEGDEKGYRRYDGVAGQADSNGYAVMADGRGEEVGGGALPPPPFPLRRNPVSGGKEPFSPTTSSRAGGGVGGPGLQPRSPDAINRPGGTAAVPLPGLQPEDIAERKAAYAKMHADLERKHNSLRRPFQRPLRDAKKAGSDIPVARYQKMSKAEKEKLREEHMKKNAELTQKRAEIARKIREFREKQLEKEQMERNQADEDDDKEVKKGRFFGGGKRNSSGGGTSLGGNKKGAEPQPVGPVVLPPGAKYKKPGMSAKMLSSLPVVKRAFRPSPEEELYGDAALSFVAGIRMGVYDSNGPLPGKRKAALTDWLDLLRVSLPPELGVHEIIDALRFNIDYVSEGQAKLNEILNKHPLSIKVFSRSCSKGFDGRGFSCGFWKLLHLMSVGLAEQRGGLELCLGDDVDEGGGDVPRTFTPLGAAAVLREYMAFFFGCQTCRSNFISKYDECAFNRCIRLVGDEPDQIAIEEWREFPLWIWEFHNDVSVKVADVKARISDGKDSQKRGDAPVRQWPGMEECFLCIKEDGEWDMQEVYEYLEKTYWSGSEIDGPDKALKQYERTLAMSPGGRSRFMLCVGLGLLVSFAYAVRRRKLIVTSMLKQFDTTPGGGVGGKKA